VLSRVEVSNFQSVRKAVVPFGRLTVITGPTGSGKSALFRALYALARNVRGTSAVSAGQKSLSVATGNGAWAVRLTRSLSARGKNEYAVARLADGTWSTVKYTKLAGQVPGPAAELLALSELNFARQLEPPYLLAVSGAEIAKRLGDLTNISVVLGAAAEAGRVRKQLSRDLDAARARREALLAEAQQFATLKARRRAVTEAEEALGRVQATASARDRLRALTDRLEAAEAASADAARESVRQAPPSLARLEELAAARGRLRDLMVRLQIAERDIAAAVGQAEAAEREEQAARDGLHAALVAIGECPVCGSRIT
jgi:DNA repair exonuclease SbcCD ATPase subunit